MGTLLFGRQDAIHCITDVSVQLQENEALCLAHKTTTTFVGAGVWLKDDGYVLAPRASQKVFYRLTPRDVAAYQAEGSLPTPLPGYSVGAFAYVVGYSLWWLLALVAIGGVITARLKKMRLAKREAELAVRPISYGPPRLETPGDHFIADQIAPHLRAGERVLHQAYATFVDGLVADAWFVVLTNARIHFVKTRVGAFKPLLENRGIESIDRDALRRLATDENVIEITTHDGVSRQFLVPPKETAFSNQRDFVLDVPRIVCGEPRLPTGGR